jgi:hypothetical protein
MHTSSRSKRIPMMAISILGAAGFVAVAWTGVRWRIDGESASGSSESVGEAHADEEGALHAAGSYGYVPLPSPSPAEPTFSVRHRRDCDDLDGSRFDEGQVLWTYAPEGSDGTADHAEDHRIAYWVTSRRDCQRDTTPFLWSDCWSAHREWLDTFEINGADIESGAANELHASYCVFEKAPDDPVGTIGSWSKDQRGRARSAFMPKFVRIVDDGRAALRARHRDISMKLSSSATPRSTTCQPGRARPDRMRWLLSTGGTRQSSVYVRTRFGCLSPRGLDDVEVAEALHAAHPGALG